MLDDRDIPFRYREYRKEPLTVAELSELFVKLGVEPADLLRRNDRAAKDLELTGDETSEELTAHMAEHPTLLQRPIGVKGGQAVVARPPERLLDLLD